MKKVLSLNGSGSQLNVPILKNGTSDVLTSNYPGSFSSTNQPLPESYLLIQFLANDNPFSSGNITIKIPFTNGSTSEEYSKTFSSVNSSDTLKIPRLSSGNEFPIITSTNNIMKFITGTDISSSPVNISNLIHLYDVSNTNVSEINYNISDGSEGTSNTSSVNYGSNSVSDPVSPNKSFILAIPYFSDSNAYIYSKIELEMNNPAVTDLQFQGMKHLTKMIICGATTEIKWHINEYYLGSITECS